MTQNSPETKSIREVLIVGRGAVGSVLGATLAEAGVRVRFVVRGVAPKLVHLIGVREVRRAIETVTWAELTGIEPETLVILATKSFDVAAAAREVENRTRGVFTKRLVLANGLGIAELVPECARGLTWLGARVLPTEARTVEWVSSGRIELAAAAAVGPAASAGSLELIAECLRATGIPVSVPGLSARALEWKKSALNLVVNPVAALAGVTSGEILRQPELARQAQSIHAEASAVAAAEGAQLPSWGEIEAEIARVAGNRNSMLADLEAHRPTENEWLSAAVVRRGKALGVAVPTHEWIANEIRARENSRA